MEIWRVKDGQWEKKPFVSTEYGRIDDCFSGGVSLARLVTEEARGENENYGKRWIVFSESETGKLTAPSDKLAGRQTHAVLDAVIISVRRLLTGKTIGLSVITVNSSNPIAVPERMGRHQFAIQIED